ncbi:MAG: hypothetical protein AMXMBFR53_06980 [Gemmatimonadota bacterium]
MMARWAEQGWLRRVRRGLYLAVPVDAEHPELWSEDALVLASVVWDPCYVTGWTAGNYWSLTEQVFQTVVVRTTNRVRDPDQTLLDHRYLVGKVAPRRLTWGLKKVWFRDKAVAIADEARVIVDVLDDPSIGGGIRHCADMLATYLLQHSDAELIRYGEMLGNGAVFKRLGFLCEHLRLTGPSFLESCERRLTTGYAVLDPAGEPGERRDTRWRVVANARFERRSES